MPRGRTKATKPKKTEQVVAPIASPTTKLRRAPPRGRKKMADSENSTSRKRKPTAAEPSEEAKAVENGFSRSKKAKITRREESTSTAVVEETDRAVEVVQGPTGRAAVPRQQVKKGGAGKDKVKVRAGLKIAAPAVSAAATGSEGRINHHSHKRQPGQVLVLGQGDTGQLGLGENVVEKTRPFPVGGALDGCVVQVACGGMHTAALTDTGKVFTWGCNDEGALGRETRDGEECSPGQVIALQDVGVVQLSAGDSHTAALAENGDVYCWGVFRDSNGPFGLVHTDAPSASPAPQLVYSSPSNAAVKIASGNDHVVLLTTGSDIITFGCAEQGQLGRVPEIFSSRGGRKGTQLLLRPQPIRFRKPRNTPSPRFLDVFCGSYHTFALTEDEAVYTWGLNNYGQLGTDDTESRFQPERLPVDWIKEEGVKENRREGNTSRSRRYEGLVISGGQHHTVLCNKGSVYVLGRREYGRLGLGQNSALEPATPMRVPTLDKVTEVSASTVCSFAVNEGGELFSWGMGTNLQLGNGQEDDVWTPCRVSGKKLEGKKVTGVSAGGQHTALLACSSQKTGKK